MGNTLSFISLSNLASTLFILSFSELSSEKLILFICKSVLRTLVIQYNSLPLSFDRLDEKINTKRALLIIKFVFDFHVAIFWSNFSSLAPIISNVFQDTLFLVLG